MTVPEWKLKIVKSLLVRRDQEDRRIKSEKEIHNVAPSFTQPARPMTAHEAYDDAIDIVVNAEVPE